MANFQERENFWISCVHKSFYDCEQENDLYQYDCRQAPVLHGDGAGLTGLEPQNNHNYYQYVPRFMAQRTWHLRSLLTSRYFRIAAEAENSNR